MVRTELPEWGSPEMLEDPFPFYENARATAPVSVIPGRDTYLVSKRADIEFILMNPELFTVKGRSPSKTYPGQRYPTMLDLSNTDPPEHKPLRNTYMTLLSPRQINRLRPEIERKAHQLIDRFSREPEVELVQAYALPLPTWFMGTLLGVEESMHPQLVRWASDYFDLHDSKLHNTKNWSQVEPALQQSYVDFMNFCGDLVTGLRVNPPGGALSDFAFSRDLDGEPYTVDELANQVRLLISGSQTTIESIAQAVVDIARLEDRGDLSDARHVQRLVEESIRKDGPATYIPRIALQDVELSGVTIPAGARILLSVQSGNRDEAFFGCPEAFDADRANLMRHVGFGLGIHSCVGAGTARAETVTAVQALFSRFREIRLSPENDFLHRTDLTQMRVLKAVHLELHE